MSADLQNYFERQFTELDEMLGEQAMLQDQQVELDREIARRTQKIAQIASTCEDDLDPTSPAAGLVRGIREGGLSAAIRNIYKAAGEPLGTVDVLRELRAINFPLCDYQNVHATLHLTLKRLHRQGEIEEQTTESGKRVYVWKVRDALADNAERIRAALGLGKAKAQSVDDQRKFLEGYLGASRRNAFQELAKKKSLKKRD